MKGVRKKMLNRVTVEELYEYYNDKDEPMFTDFVDDFWDMYRVNYMYFDKLFCSSYRSFIIYGIKNELDMQYASITWEGFVTAFLLSNRKRYAELYRLQNISDTDYSILEPYNVTETHTTSNTGNITDNKGAKTRSTQNSTSFGAVSTTDRGSNVHGAKTESDSERRDYGQDKTVTSEENVTGSQNNEQHHKVSAQNESTYAPKDLVSDALGTRTDTVDKTETRNSRIDNISGLHTEASFTDTIDNTRSVGAHSDTENSTIQDSAYTDARNSTERGTKEVTKKGNMGIYSLPKLLSEHKELWDAFNFYKMIFDEMANEFLRVDYI